MPTPRRPVGNSALKKLREIDAAAKHAARLARDIYTHLNNPDLIESRSIKIAELMAQIQLRTLEVVTGEDME